MSLFNKVNDVFDCRYFWNKFLREQTLKCLRRIPSKFGIPTEYATHILLEVGDRMTHMLVGHRLRVDVLGENDQVEVC